MVGGTSTHLLKPEGVHALSIGKYAPNFAQQ